jgi:hypothetical protein
MLIGHIEDVRYDVQNLQELRRQTWHVLAQDLVNTRASNLKCDQSYKRGNEGSRAPKISVALFGDILLRFREPTNSTKLRVECF